MKIAVFIAMLMTCLVKPVDAGSLLGMTTANLYRMCTSTNADERATCNGYIDTTALVWSTMGCPLDSPDDLSFCKGAEDSGTRMYKAQQSCVKTCSDRDYDDASRFDRCNSSCILNNEAVLPDCSPGADRSKAYCFAFNATIERTRALYTLEEEKSARQKGITVSVRDQIGLAFAQQIPGASFLTFWPCLKALISPTALKALFLKFVDDNPETLSSNVDESAPPLELLNTTFAIVAMDRAFSASICDDPRN